MAGQARRQLQVGLEAPGIYWEAVAEYCADAGHRLSVVNPAHINAFGRSCAVRTQTDTVDARLIAQFCQALNPAPWAAPSATERALKALVARREALIALRTPEHNRLRVARAVLQAGIERHRAWLAEEMAHLEARIRELIDQDPDLGGKRDLLDSIPGLGEGTSATLVAFLAAPRFDTARQVAACAGLNPRQWLSGSSVRGQPHLAKVGHAALRKALSMPAMVTLNKTAWGRGFQIRLKAAGKAPMVIIGAMMRKLLHVAYGVLKSGQPFTPALHGV